LRLLLVAGMCHGAMAGAPPSEARLISEVDTIQAGKPFTMGVWIALPPGWHTYWINPGDSGMAPELTWKIPDGFRAGPMQWPAPRRFDEPPMASFGYGDEVLLCRVMHPPPELPTNRPLTFTVQANWMVCSNICVFRKEALSLDLSSRAGPPAVSAAWGPLFSRTHGVLPVSDKRWTFRAVAAPTTLTLRVTPPPEVNSGRMNGALFFPAQRNLVEYGPSAWRRAGGEYCLTLERFTGTKVLPERLHGVLVLESEAGAARMSIEVDTAIEATTRGG
jgi:DsbC/DsbD-like thiol-disulfide interchange protein